MRRDPSGVSQLPFFRSWPAVLTMLAALVTPLQAADAIFPPGSRIGLTPPSGMVVSQNFQGFEDAGKKAALLLVELPGPAYEEFLKSMSAGAINVPGVTNAKREILMTEGGAAHLITGDQEADGVRFRKWLFLTRRAVASHRTDATIAFLVTAQVPVDSQNAYPDAAIRSALSSVILRAKIPNEEVLSQLPFKLTDLANFTSVRSLVPGRAVLLSEDETEAEPVGRPHLVVSIGPGAPSQPDDRRRFAEQLLRGVQGYKDLRITSAEPMRLNNQQAFEIRLEGKSATTDADVMVVQWVRFGGQGFLRLVGVSPKQEWSDVFPRFRAVRDGIEAR
jgi:hypothetical protein